MVAVTATVHFSAAVTFFQSVSPSFSSVAKASRAFPSNCLASSVPKRSRGPGPSPQPFDLLGQDAGEVLPALLVAATHLVVGEPVVRQHQVGGAAGRRQLDGHPGLEPA